MNSHRLNNFEGSIFICGFMASGKSTIGKAIARRLDWEYRDLDAVIVERTGKTIHELFREEGESYFRKKEWECLLDLSRNFKGVVSLGGGALHNQQVVDHLKLQGLLLFLDAPMEEVVKRVQNSKKRPILYDEDGKIKSKETLFAELKALYSNREAFYKQAQITLNTTLYTSVEEKTDAAIEKIIRHV